MVHKLARLGVCTLYYDSLEYQQSDDSDYQSYHREDASSYGEGSQSLIIFWLWCTSIHILHRKKENYKQRTKNKYIPYKYKTYSINFAMIFWTSQYVKRQPTYASVNSPLRLQSLWGDYTHTQQCHSPHPPTALYNPLVSSYHWLDWSCTTHILDWTSSV